jgi:hypothetical protein
MPVTIIDHEDGTKSVVETDEHGDHHVFDINADGSRSEREQSGSAQSHQDVVDRYSRDGDTDSETFEGDSFDDLGGGEGEGEGGYRPGT